MASALMDWVTLTVEDRPVLAGALTLTTIFVTVGVLAWVIVLAASEG